MGVFGGGCLTGYRYLFMGLLIVLFCLSCFLLCAQQARTSPVQPKALLLLGKGYVEQYFKTRQ